MIELTPKIIIKTVQNKQTKKMDHVYTHQLHFENSSLISANVYGIINFKATAQ